jgi:hypothetical protein
MPVEQDDVDLHGQVSPTYGVESAQIKALWQELPDAHQVALVLQLANSVMSGPLRLYLRYAMIQQWPVRPNELPVAFPRFEITEDDLIQANLDEEDAAQLTAENRQEIAETMRNHFIHDVFWPELRYMAGLLLEKLANEREAT